jgi:uncharacterized protein
MCVGCRGRDAQHRLLRLCVVQGRVVADRRRGLPGRGAYVHFRKECLDQGVRRGGIARGLRCPVGAKDLDFLRELVVGAIDAE